MSVKWFRNRVAPPLTKILVARGLRHRRGQMLDRDTHQLRQSAHTELGLELCVGVGDGLIAHVQILGDDANKACLEQRGQKSGAHAPSPAAMDWARLRSRRGWRCAC